MKTDYVAQAFTRQWPRGPITPQGLVQLLDGEPMVWLVSHDEELCFHLWGGRSVVDRRYPEAVRLTPGGLRDLQGPPRPILQQSATDDGARFVAAYDDPAEMTLDLIVTGRNAEHVQMVLADLLAAVDKSRPARLHCWTRTRGPWSTEVRQMRTSSLPVSLSAKSTRVQLVLSALSGSWETMAHTDSFRFRYESLTEAFSFKQDVSTATTLGPNLPLRYSGTGGYITADGSKAVWKDQVASSTYTRSVVCGPYVGFNTATDNQVVTVDTGGPGEPAIPEGGFLDIWARMGRASGSNSWNGNGIRARCGWGKIVLSRFANFSETVMFTRPLIVPPWIGGEQWQLVAGQTDDPRLFRVLRNGTTALAHKESGTASKLGADHRGVGFGMQASAALVSQASPPPVRRLRAGDNAAVTQSGYLTRVNCGDRDADDSYTVFGPGTFRFYTGATDFVEFGPLLENQVVRIDTHPDRQMVTDLTSVPPSPAQQTAWEKAMSDLLDFVGGRDTPLVSAIKSQWGITPPQGNLGALLKGRFPASAMIPGKPTAGPPVPVTTRVEIVNGTAQSRIIARLVARRKFPL